MNIVDLIEIKNRLTVASCNLLSSHNFGIDKKEDEDIQEILAACSIQEAYLMNAIMTNGKGIIENHEFKIVVSTIEAIEKHLNEM